MSAALRLAFFPVLGILGAHRLLGDTTAYNVIWLICMVWGLVDLYLWWRVFRAMWAVLFRSSARRVRRRRTR